MHGHMNVKLGNLFFVYFESSQRSVGTGVAFLVHNVAEW